MSADGPIVWMAGTNWDSVAGTDKRLVRELSATRPVMWVDPPVPVRLRLRSGTRTPWTAVQGVGSAPPLEQVGDSLLRLKVLAPPGVTRPFIRQITAWWLERAITSAVAHTGWEPAAVVSAMPLARFPHQTPGLKILYLTDDWLEGSGLQRVPHRRRVRLAALRLRPAAPRGDARRSPRPGWAWSSTCGATRVAASASATRSARTACRRRATTPSTPTSHLGLPVDSREYGIGAQILVDLGITTMRLMTNNPAKYGGLEGYGLEIVERVPLETTPNPENIRYLRTKRERMGHLLEGLDDVL